MIEDNFDQSKLLFEKQNNLYKYLLILLNVYGIVYLFFYNPNYNDYDFGFLYLILILIQLLLIFGVRMSDKKVKNNAIKSDLYLIYSIVTYIIYSTYIINITSSACNLLLFCFVILNIVVLNKKNVIILGSLGIGYYLVDLISIMDDNVSRSVFNNYYNKMVLIAITIFFSIKAIDIFRSYKQTIILQNKDIYEQKEVLAEYNNELENSEKELKDNYEKMFQLAYYDKLTELPNRDYFFEYLVNICLDENNSRDIILIDIDNFKSINDFYSHDIGDEVLLFITDLLRNISGPDSIIGRVDGDIFSVILSENTKSEFFLEELEKSTHEPLSVNHYDINISLSMGVVNFPHSGKTPSDLFKNMELAMYKAKELGKGQYIKYTKDLSERMIKRVDMIEKLRHSIDNKEIYLVYQPVFDSMTCELKGYEALARWKNDVLGSVRPDIFIKLAEETGFIIDLSDWIFREAALFAKKINQNEKKVFVSINLSGVQFQYENLYKYVTSFLSKFEIDPEIIGIEITETSIIEYFDYAVPNLLNLRELGIRISLDDFGTGYSSLNYLRKLPINTLKIDKTFIDEMLIESKAATVINNLINLANELELDTVAEGVETKEQLDFLKANKCNFIQGFYLSKPLSEGDAINIFNEHYAN